MIILLTVGLTKNILLYKMSYLPEPHTHSKHKIKAELDLSNYAKKALKKQQVLIHQILLKTLMWIN